MGDLNELFIFTLKSITRFKLQVFQVIAHFAYHLFTYLFIHTSWSYLIEVCGIKTSCGITPIVNKHLWVAYSFF